MKFKLIAILCSSLLAASAMASGNNFGPAAGSSKVSASAAGVGGGLGVAILSAVVDADGTLVRGSGASSVVKVGTGNYRVLFKRSVRDCAYVATIGLSGAVSTEANGGIDTAGDNLDVKGVFVDINDMASVSADRGFHLVVFCSQ